MRQEVQSEYRAGTLFIIPQRENPPSQLPSSDGLANLKMKEFCNSGQGIVVFCGKLNDFTLARLRPPVTKSYCRCCSRLGQFLPYRHERKETPAWQVLRRTRGIPSVIQFQALWSTRGSSCYVSVFVYSFVAGPVLAEIYIYDIL